MAILSLYYSNKCEHSKRLIQMIQRYPEIYRKFKLVCVDRYYQKFRKFPPGVKGTPVIHEEEDDEIGVYESDDAFEFVNRLINSGRRRTQHQQSRRPNPRQGGQERTQNNQRTQHRQPRHTQYDDDYYNHWTGTTGIMAVTEPEEWPDWARGADGEKNNDPSIFLEPMRDGPRGDDLNRRIKELEDQRKAAEKGYHRRKPIGGGNRQIVI